MREEVLKQRSCACNKLTLELNSEVLSSPTLESEMWLYRLGNAALSKFHANTAYLSNGVGASLCALQNNFMKDSLVD